MMSSSLPESLILEYYLLSSQGNGQGRGASPWIILDHENTNDG
jgi:hypothetical protein